MPPATLLTSTGQKVWKNRHDTFSQTVDDFFDIANPETGSGLQDYNTTTATIQQLIGSAIDRKKSLRALGGGWSFTKVAATDGWIVNTKQLNLIFNIRQDSIDAAYSGDRNQLLMTQCGVSIQELNTFLQRRGKSLKTCGASNGQTIVGAFSTGTHGSAIDVGTTADFVVGLHMAVSPNRHIWLERASYPVASATLVTRLNAELVRDDELFNAAVVSFGSFGFILGAMIETENLYLLEAHRLRLPMDDSMKYIMQSLDFSGATLLPRGSERPFHFQVVVDQYDLAGGAYVTVMYKRPYRAGYPSPKIEDPGKAGPGDDVPAFLGKVTDLLPVVTPLMVSALVKASYTLYAGVMGTCGEIFTNNNIRGRVLSTALGIPVQYAVQVNELLIGLHREHGPFTGIFSYRYTRKSEATLAFTRFEPTLVLELDGVESAVTRRFYQVVWLALQEANIPYTFHWGKIGNLNPATTRAMYGQDMDRWIRARNTLLSSEGMEIFCNKTLRDWGLDTVLP